MKKITNKAKKGGTFYYAVKLYKNGKYIGCHNGIYVTKKVQCYIKEVIDLFINELKEKVKENPSIKLVIEKKMVYYNLI